LLPTTVLMLPYWSSARPLPFAVNRQRDGLVSAGVLGKDDHPHRFVDLSARRHAANSVQLMHDD
jgi:hypothetical protein